ncbi:hypothetical protein E6P09_02360 [Haloferax mediterranei ATCC 33500]|uniref:Yip1 domain-containing protein n=1 Tax=Haloferax mediterranei (strain ATCC 33500 / DSM 1411 / JCM 8866 / NBRC 14739 / NCIMB 2177 / R-4) TaxID=523841 RepID=A0A4P8P8T8_HALMT|nr:hypothetical protein [Haloferax mediterranei]QCQ74179.1 hypothetical protein E6P09_02360 [Haloferax mediterranei ATCC 33500]
MIGALLAVFGLVFGFHVGDMALEMVSTSEATIERIPESTVQSGTRQLIGLMIASVIFILLNSVLSQIPIVGSFTGFNSSISEALFETAKSVVLVAIPLTIVLIVSTITICDLMYKGGEISRKMRNTTIFSTMTIFPMVMFYQVGVERLTM